MGRPLHKKYFGNRNIGTTGTTDNEIGGEGVASYGTIVAGSGWTSQPSRAISAPTIPGGVSATGVVHYKALSFATTANGSGYNVGDVLEVDTGVASTKAKAPVAAILVVAAEVNAPGDGYAVNDVLVYSTGFDTNVQITVTSISDPDVNGFGPVTGISLTAGGVRTLTAAGTPFAHDNVLGGSGCTVNFTWGAFSFGTVSTPGDYTTFPSTGGAGTLTSVSPATGTGAKADVTMGLLSIVVTEKGSGYTSPADAQITFSGGTGAAATAVLTTDSGNVGSATNQENAILMTAFLVGGSAVAVDIKKQVSGRRYKVTDGTRTGTVKLSSTLADAAGEGSVAVLDSAGGEYFATKITAHRVTLTIAGGSGHLYATGQQAPWKLVAPVGAYVQIANA